MKQKKKSQQDNYLRKLAYLRRMGALPNGVAEVDVFHEPDCPHAQGRTCTCDCDVKIRWVQPSAARN
jgi:hypothetical protein